MPLRASPSRRGTMWAAGVVVVGGLALAGPGCKRSVTTVVAIPAPAVIDSHVHLAYWPVAERLAGTAIGAVVDLGAPLEAIRFDGPLPVTWSGPMITRPGGYPMDAWDPGGFGVGCADRACVEGAIAAAFDRGARVVKLAFGADGIDPELAAIAVADAHARGLKVAAHALDDAAAAAAAAVGCDVLAHTPLERLSDATVAAWSPRAVISTLAAFGGGPDAVDNLRRLRAAGTLVLYGTDLGNSRVAGVDPEELRLLGAAGLDSAAVVAAMTTAPAKFWGLTVRTVLLPRDPRRDPTAYLQAIDRRGLRATPP